MCRKQLPMMKDNECVRRREQRQLCGQRCSALDKIMISPLVSKVNLAQLNLARRVTEMCDFDHGLFLLVRNTVFPWAANSRSRQSSVRSAGRTLFSQSRAKAFLTYTA